MVEKTQARETVIELIWFVSTVYTKKNFLKVCPCIELGSLLAHFQSSPGEKSLGASCELLQIIMCLAKLRMMRNSGGVKNATCIYSKPGKRVQT